MGAGREGATRRCGASSATCVRSFGEGACLRPLEPPFAALWLPISVWGVTPVDGMALWPFNLTLADSAGKEVAHHFVADINTIAPRQPAPILGDWIRLAPSTQGTVLPAGRDLVTMTASSLINRTYAVCVYMYATPVYHINRHTGAHVSL